MARIIGIILVPDWLSMVILNPGKWSWMLAVDQGLPFSLQVKKQVRMDVLLGSIFAPIEYQPPAPG
jgi:hypothetical protein